MKCSVFSKSIVGYKNKIKNKSTQDYLQVKKINKNLVCTIADGHSGDFFSESHKGSRYACDASVFVIEKYNDIESKDMNNLLRDQVIQKEICAKWRELVLADMKNSLPSVFKPNYFKYGTTLLTVLITENYILFLKLGDGDILIKENGEIKRILPISKKGIVDCLAEEKSYEKMIFKVEDKIDNMSDIIIFSDGYENSFISSSEMFKAIDDTIDKYKKNIFTRFIVEKNYHKYLDNLNENGSRDDISIIFVNIL